MARGRKPQPDAVKAAKGNPGKRRLADPAADVPVGVTKPTSKLTQAALSIWRELAPGLERMNFLRPTDRHAFARYCDTVARYWQATESLRKSGAVYETDSLHGKMQRVHPMFVVEERLAKRLTDLEDRFGLTPAARQQVMLRLAQAAPQLPFALTAPPGPGDAPADSPIGMLGKGSVH